MSTTEFIAWLQEELKKRGWVQTELARRGRISFAQISRIMTEERPASPAVCLKIARALQLPPEEVFRRAGILPRRTTPEGAEELLYYYGNIRSEDHRRVVVALVRSVYQLDSSEERDGD